MLTEKNSLIDRYEIRVEVARIERMYTRVHILTKTLSCFKNSRSKKDLLICKADERRRIMKIIRG